MGAAAVEHAIETSVKVYLDWQDDRWVVSHTVMDGHALDERDSGAEAVCSHDTDADRKDCQAVTDRAAVADMPTGPELLQLLHEAAQQ